MKTALTILVLLAFASTAKAQTYILRHDIFGKPVWVQEQPAVVSRPLWTPQPFSRPVQYVRPWTQPRAFSYPQYQPRYVAPQSTPRMFTYTPYSSRANCAT